MKRCSAAGYLFCPRRLLELVEEKVYQERKIKRATRVVRGA